jgi:hypothetical protein
VNHSESILPVVDEALVLRCVPESTDDPFTRPQLGACASSSRPARGFGLVLGRCKNVSRRQRRLDDSAAEAAQLTPSVWRLTFQQCH